MRGGQAAAFAAVVLVVVVDAIVVVGAARADNRRPVAPADGAAISGYTVSDVRYRLDQSDPGWIASVSFRLSPSGAHRVLARLSRHGARYPCRAKADRFLCATIGPTIAIAKTDGLTVAASG